MAFDADADLSLAPDLAVDGPGDPAPAMPRELFEDVGEPLTPHVVRSLLDELVRISLGATAADEQLEADFASRRQQIERDTDAARTEIAARIEGDVRAARSQASQEARRVADDFDRQIAALTEQYAAIEAHAKTAFAEDSERAARQHKDARWEAETVFDATRHAPAKRLAVVRKKVNAATGSLAQIEGNTAKLLELWHQQVPKLVAEDTSEESAAGTDQATETPVPAADIPAPAAEPPAPVPASLAVLEQHVTRAVAEWNELAQLRLPRLLVARRTAALALVALVGLSAGAWALAGIHAAWIVAVLAAIGIAVLRTILSRRAAAQVADVYRRLFDTIAEAKTQASQVIDAAKRRRVRQEAEISERLERERGTADERYDARRAELGARRQSQLDEAVAHYPPRLEKLKVDRRVAVEELSASAEQAAAERSGTAVAEQAAIEEEGRGRVAANRLLYEQARHELSTSWDDAMRRVEELAQKINAREAEVFVDWTRSGHVSLPADRRPPSIRFGHLDLAIGSLEGPRAADQSQAAPRPVDSISLPALLPISRPSLLIKTRGSGRDRAVEAMQAVILRLLTSLPPGKVRFTMIDAVGLGDNFAAFMHLADFDESLVSTRIWTERSQIERQLAEISQHIENVIQKYLRNEFENIDQYNAYAGEIAEPLRVLVVANFPAGFTDEAARQLLSILRSGARCGVSTLMSVDLDLRLPAGVDLVDLERNSTVVIQKKRRAIWRDERLRHLRLTLEKPPASETFIEILQQVGREAQQANRIEVPFEFIAPAADRYWTARSAQGIDVPLGRSGATRLQHLKLGQGTAQHALVAGQTGSGKSTLLHALITNVALRYSPDEVQLYLVDFKKGVEFKTYAAHRLPHARVVAIESDREFGLSVLERLDEELKQRAERFRAAGVPDIAAYRRAQPEAVLPRILLVVDEFQELFVEDDKISQTSALLLDRLIRQGRAFGMHLLLGSQTLGGAYSIARSTMGQIGVRIALQCSEVDAHLILSEDNSAARLLSRPGEAIYNDNNGFADGNRPFQVVWIDEEAREAYLTKVQELSRAAAGEAPEQIVFEGNAPAELEKNAALLAALGGAQPGQHGPLQAWLGESVSIKEPTSAVFRPQSGSNLLVVGQNDQGALGVTSSLVLSLVAQLRQSGSPQQPQASRIVLLNGAPSSSPESNDLERLAAACGDLVELVGWRDAGAALGQLAADVERRAAQHELVDGPKFLVIYGLQRFRELRRGEDDFSFSRSGENKPPDPAEQLAAILREGPSLDVHTIVWCDSLNSVNRAFDRRALAEFEMRIAFQMSGADSSLLLDTPAGAKLGPYRALYGNEEAGRVEKFRPYRFPSDNLLSQASGSDPSPFGLP